MFICDFRGEVRGLKSFVMSTMAPGDFLRCIQVDVGKGQTVEIGQVYCCEDVVSHDDMPGHYGCTVHGPKCGAGGVKLREKPIPVTAWWCQACFEPIYKPKIDWQEFVKIKLPADPDRVKGPVRELT